MDSQAQTLDEVVHCTGVEQDNDLPWDGTGSCAIQKDPSICNSHADELVLAIPGLFRAFS